MKIALCSPAQGETVDLLTAEHRAMLSGKHLAQVDNDLDWTNLKQKGTEKSYPQPVRFAWKAEQEGMPDDIYFELSLSGDADFAQTKKLYFDPDIREAEVYNFSAGCGYYWKVSAISRSDGKTEYAGSPVGRFCTKDDVPTLYRVDGLTNVRDIGGWRTFDGRRVKRGMIFRGSEMDTHHQLTEAGRKALIDDLRVRTDLDLRGEAVGKISESPIGADVRFELLPVKAYAEFLEPERFGECRDVFSLLTDETAYPIYLHCWGGADRSGTVVLLLNGLMGVDDESLLLDYEMTMFSVWGERSRYSDLFTGMLKELDRYGGENRPLRVKAENYLRRAGVTDSQITKLRSLLIE